MKTYADAKTDSLAAESTEDSSQDTNKQEPTDIVPGKTDNTEGPKAEDAEYKV